MALEEDRLLRLPQVLERVGLSRSSWYALVADGDAPASVPLGARARAWLASEVREWVKKRVAARSKAREQRAAA